jgi:hypothetical protein
MQALGIVMRTVYSYKNSNNSNNTSNNISNNRVFSYQNHPILFSS